MEIVAGTNPFTLFKSWFDEAVAAEINDPDAIALASVNELGMPSVRMVLLRQWSEDGFLFFTDSLGNCWPPAKRLFVCIGKACASKFG